jgi:hypothetical protein
MEAISKTINVRIAGRLVTVRDFSGISIHGHQIFLFGHGYSSGYVQVDGSTWTIAFVVNDDFVRSSMSRDKVLAILERVLSNDQMKQIITAFP